MILSTFMQNLHQKKCITVYFTEICDIIKDETVEFQD